MRVSGYALAAILVAVASGAVRAEGCADYPYTPSVTVEPVAGGTRIIATAAVGISFDDVDAVNDARDEATLAAKAMITDFLEQQVSKDEEIKKVVENSKSMQGASKQEARTETVQRLKRLAGSSSKLLRGVVPLGDCYTATKEFRVSVGLKPETIAAVTSTERAMVAGAPAAPGRPGNQAATGGQASERVPGVAGSPLVPVPSFSNTDALRRF